MSRPPDPALIKPGDPRYEDLSLRRNNERFAHRPEYFVVARTSADVVAAVGDAVRRGLRVAVRSGGHSMENSVGEAQPTMVIDMSEMAGICFDPDLRAFSVEPGVTVGRLKRSLYLAWGVTVPAGWCPGVCAGGHIVGGGYGALSRSLGSIVDYLHAVEVVVVDAAGGAEAVRAVRGGPHHDLWWAHTGGGGGNFGVITRYWLRSPEAVGDDPGALLPVPPAALVGGSLSWSWDALDRDAFHRLMRNHASWHERHSDPGCPENILSSSLTVTGRSVPGGRGDIRLSAQLDATRPDAPAMMASYFDAVGDGVPGMRYLGAPEAWLRATLPPESARLRRVEAERDRYKGKAGYLRTGFTPAQVETIHRYLADPPPVELARLSLVGYGGQVNAVAADATAMPQRDSILKAAYTATWTGAQNDEAGLDWIRRFYRDVYADTGGVPATGATSDGAYVNYPDTDLADPGWNTSDSAWHDLYYKANYPRLQRIKSAWDPRNVFRHALSVRPAAAEDDRRTR